MSTSCDDDDGEPIVNYRSGPTTARVAHPCDCCTALIRPGDIHYSASWLCCGNYESFRRCARCHLLYLELVKLHRKHDIRDDYNEPMGVDPDLNCGHSFQKVFGREPPEELTRLAFLTPDEVQAMLATGAAQ